MEDERTRLVELWKKSGLLDGLNGKYTGSLAELMECEASKLLREENENNK